MSLVRHQAKGRETPSPWDQWVASPVVHLLYGRLSTNRSLDLSFLYFLIIVSLPVFLPSDALPDELVLILLKLRNASPQVASCAYSGLPEIVYFAVYDLRLHELLF